MTVVSSLLPKRLVWQSTPQIFHNKSTVGYPCQDSALNILWSYKNIETSQKIHGEDRDIKHGRV